MFQHKKMANCFFSLLPLLFLRLIPVTITAVLPLPAVIPSTTIPSTAIAIAAYYYCIWLSRWLSGKESTCHAGDAGAVPGLGRSPGEGNGNPLQYSCLGNPMDRGGWWATVQEVTKSRTGLSTRTHMHTQASYYGGVSCCRAQVLEHGLQ